MIEYQVEYNQGGVVSTQRIWADEFRDEGDWLLAIAWEGDGIEREVGRWRSASVFQAFATGERK